MNKSKGTWRWIWILVLGGFVYTGESQGEGMRLGLEKPGEFEIVRDLAGLVDDESEKRITEGVRKLLKEHATPIIVVTIESMAKHGGEGLRIETFARLLFDQWGIGHGEITDRAGEKHVWNTGILLLVSKGDRKARIELGAGWWREKNGVTKKIMDEYIIPRFKEGHFSEGIVDGVAALEEMARGKALPEVKSGPRPAWHYLVGIGLFGLMVFTVVSLIRRGSSGWAWIMWALIFGAVGAFLYSWLTSDRGDGGGFFGGGGFGGGGFGGGFSGGGGATGGW